MANSKRKYNEGYMKVWSQNTPIHNKYYIPMPMIFRRPCTRIVIKYDYAEKPIYQFSFNKNHSYKF